MPFLGELKRRKVFQVAAVYAVVAWLLVQIVATIEEPLSLPTWFDTAIIVLFAIGFPITLIVSWAFNLTAEGLVPDVGDPSATRGSRRIEYVLLALLLIAVSWIGFRELGPSGQTDTQTLPDSVAVLLCDNFSTDPENDFFAASLHEEFLNQLVKLRNLNVIARTSVLQYSGADRPAITDIAEELRVESVMECSVAYGDGRVVISAQLIDGETGLHIWSERYNRDFEDVFGIQADIARNVARALESELSVEEQARLEREPTNSPVAYALYLEALAAGPDRSKQLDLLNRAIDVDGEFALAYAERARILASTPIALLGDAAVAQGSSRLEELVAEDVLKALTLDSELAAAHLARATMHRLFWRWTEAETAFAKAYQLSPASTAVARFYSEFKTNRGEFADALRLGERARELDPTSANQSALWFAHVYAGNTQRAHDLLQAALSENSADPAAWLNLGFVEARRGNIDAARRAFETFESLPAYGITASSLANLAYGYSSIGDRDESMRHFSKAQESANDRSVGAGAWALGYFAIGEYEEALKWLDSALNKIDNQQPDEGWFSLMAMKANPAGHPELEEPRFRERRERIAGR